VDNTVTYSVIFYTYADLTETKEQRKIQKGKENREKEEKSGEQREVQHTEVARRSRSLHIFEGTFRLISNFRLPMRSEWNTLHRQQSCNNKINIIITELASLCSNLCPQCGKKEDHSGHFGM